MDVVADEAFVNLAARFLLGDLLAALEQVFSRLDDVAFALRQGPPAIHHGRVRGAAKPLDLLRGRCVLSGHSCISHFLFVSLKKRPASAGRSGGASGARTRCGRDPGGRPGGVGEQSGALQDGKVGNKVDLGVRLFEKKTGDVVQGEVLSNSMMGAKKEMHFEVTLR